MNRSLGNTRGYAGEADETERLRTENWGEAWRHRRRRQFRTETSSFLTGFVCGRVWLGVTACARPETGKSRLKRRIVIDAVAAFGSGESADI